MKKISLLLFFCLFIGSQFAFSQIEKPVSWQYSVKKVSNDEAVLVFNASIKKNWHLYGQYFPDGGPIRLKFTFDKSANYTLVGITTESPKPTEEFDDIFKIKINFFAKEAKFEQKIKITSVTNFVLKGSLEGQACLTDGKCVQTSEDFEFKIDGAPKTESAQKTEPENKENTTQNIDSHKIETKDSLTINTTPKVKEFKEDKNQNSSLFVFFWISLLAGLVAIFTPCVFPMIPMTVSFFMHGQKSKMKAKMEALFYGTSIVLIYTVIGTLVAFTLGPSFANFLSTHWLPNILFFLIFLLFAASFLGMFEIVLPSWIVNKADQQVDKGGFWGPFFMAFTLVLVSFSCTGPIVGAVLVQSAGGEFLKPIVGMLGFSIAFALPFTLFAFFPQWLTGLPKSGGWLNTVKVVLGFIELALGLKFLSMADLTYHWRLLDREVYLAIWIVLTFLLGMYLLGKLKFAHDSPVDKLGVPRLMLAIIAFTFGVYMIPGLFGAPLKALSGYIPPMTTQDFDISKIVRDNASVNTKTVSASTENELCETPKYSDFLHLPHGLKGYFDFEQALACAKKQGKPVFVDFTGHGCANCRKMEENVWVDPQVLSRLKEKYIIVSLYVDDKTELPEKEWVTAANGKVKKTIGDKYSYIQETRFKANSQPHYILLDGDGNQLESSYYFDVNVDKFVNFLDKGVEEFNKQKK